MGCILFRDAFSVKRCQSLAISQYLSAQYPKSFSKQSLHCFLWNQTPSQSSPPNPVLQWFVSFSALKLTYIGVAASGSLIICYWELSRWNSLIYQMKHGDFPYSYCYATNSEKGTHLKRSFFVRLTMMNHQKAPSTIPYFPQRGSQLFDPFFLKFFIAQEPQQRVKFGWNDEKLLISITRRGARITWVYASYNSASGWWF